MNDEHERAQVARAGQDRPQAQQQAGQAERQAHTQRQDQRHVDQLARGARASQQRRGAQVHAPVSPDSGQAEEMLGRSQRRDEVETNDDDDEKEDEV